MVWVGADHGVTIVASWAYRSSLVDDWCAIGQSVRIWGEPIGKSMDELCFGGDATG